MKKLSIAAVAFALTAALPSAPVLAAKNNGAASGQFVLSPAVAKVAQAADAAVQANNPTAAEPLVRQVEAAAVTDGDKYVAAVMRYQIEAQKARAAKAANPRAQVDESLQAKPLDVLIANAHTPATVRGAFVARRGEIAYNARQYPQAIHYFTQARQLGFADENLDLMIVKAKIEGGDVASGSADLERVVTAAQAKSGKAPVEYYRYAIGRSNKGRLTPQTVAWMNRYAAAYPAGPTWYEVLATYGLQQDAAARLDDQQKVDLFRLMRASGGLADQYFYLDYARRAQSVGSLHEAQAVLKEGLASGRIPAADADAKALQASLTRAIAAAGALPALETKANAATTGQLAMQAGDAYLGRGQSGDFAKAAALYRTALTKGGVDADTVNTRLGIALARSGDKAGALAAFATVQGSPRRDIASFWTTWLNGQGAAPAA